MADENLNEIFTNNPITTNTSTDLMYFMQSPYSSGTDAGMTYAHFAAQFGAPYTAAALTKTNDTNVTLTLGGTPTTALLHATSMTLGWTGQLSLTRGGTGSSLSTTLSPELVLVNGSSMEVISNVDSSILTCTAAGLPFWDPSVFITGGNFVTTKGSADQSYSLQAPSTGFSITIAANTETLILNPSTTLLAGTVIMPASPINGQEIRICSDQTITTLTISANSGQSMANAFATTLTAGTGIGFIYNLSGTTWYRLY